MVARRFVVRHNGSEFSVDYDTDDGLEVLKFQLFSLTSLPPEDQKILTEDEGAVVTEESDLESVPENLRLVSIGKEEEEEAAKKSMLAELERSDEELARILQAEEEALLLQQYSVMGNGEEFKQRVRPYLDQILMYEDPIRQEAARKSVPVGEIREKALVSLAKEGNFKPSTDEEDHAFLLQLLFWFKNSFRWVNAPPCDNCGSGTSNIGMGNALHSEIKFGASRVELYRCTACPNTTRFPRYNDPLKLIETRRGRCGEWANCFTLYCRAFGYEARLILDFTDHVWTECFSRFLGRWMHLDPCEGMYDNPLLYEKGWNKKLNYVIAIAKDGVYDVTKRYTRKWHEVLARRNITTEANASFVLSSITKECRTGYPPEALKMLEIRDSKEAEELEGEVHLQGHDSVSLPGRQSGAVEWRKARSELGSSINNSSISSSCPLRRCIDDHVTKIYSALAFLCTQFVEDELSKTESLEVLEIIRRLVMDLRTASFENRVSSLDPSISRFSEKMMLQIETLLSAMSLKFELGGSRGGSRRVSLAGDPVKTSLALPVALDIVNEIIENVKSNELFPKVMEFPRVNRLSYGSVIASGEELPFGVSTSAFDGTQTTKWEEPNGANGCWVIYGVADEQMYDLVSYDLVSANDAPERDPFDWVVEGSKDGGDNWIQLDIQSSQTFERRFQRKNFVIDKRCFCNAFRLKILAVRDPNATSRFQIGSIDLYANPTSL